MFKTFQDPFENFDAIFFIFSKRILRGSCKGNMDRLVEKKLRFAVLLIKKSCFILLIHQPNHELQNTFYTGEQNNIFLFILFDSI